MNKSSRLVFSSICLAFSLILSFLTERFEWFARSLCPMHIPVFVCAIVTGPIYGTLIGFLSPFLCFVIYGLPLLFPNAVAMAFELAAYGFFTGFLTKFFKNKNFLYIILAFSMIVGRVVWSLIFFLLLNIKSMNKLGFFKLLTYVFTVSIAGMIFQILFIPLISFNILKKQR